MTISPNRRSTKRGRPLVTDGVFRCTRCQRMANQRRATWPGEQLCYSCFYSSGAGWLRVSGRDAAPPTTIRLILSPARRSEHRAHGTVFLGEKGQVSVAVDTHFCRLRSAHAERRRHRDNTYHANTANTLAQRSGSRDLAVLRPVRPGAYIGLGTDRTMSITALRCEGSHISGGVGDGARMAPKGHKTGSRWGAHRSRSGAA